MYRFCPPKSIYYALFNRLQMPLQLSAGNSFLKVNFLKIKLTKVRNNFPFGNGRMLFVTIFTG